MQILLCIEYPESGRLPIEAGPSSQHKCATCVVRGQASVTYVLSQLSVRDVACLRDRYLCGMQLCRHEVLNSLPVRGRIARIVCRDLSYCLSRRAELEVFARKRCFCWHEAHKQAAWAARQLDLARFGKLHKHIRAFQYEFHSLNVHLHIFSHLFLEATCLRGLASYTSHLALAVCGQVRQG